MFDFKSIVDSLPEALYVIDADGCNVRYVNEAIQDISGYTSQEYFINPKLWQELIHKDDKTCVQNSIRSAEVEGRSTVEYRIHRKDGRVCWVQSRNMVIRALGGKGDLVVGMLFDITLHKEQLESAKENLDELLEESVTVIYRCEPSGDYPATYISNNIKRQLGYEPEQFTSDPGFWASKIHPDDREHVFSNLGKLFEKGYHSHEYRFLNGNGAYVWMHDELRLSKDANGEIKDIIGNWIDITKTKQLELEKAEHEQAIQQANKMQAIGTLAGGIAHEFNNMLGVIIGYTELLSKPDVLPESRDTYTRHVMTAAHRSKKLVQQLLSFSHKGPKNIQPINLCHLIEEEIDFLRSTIPTSIKLDLKTECSCASILGDKDEIRQTLINLVSNAAFAMQNKGNLSISIDDINIDNTTMSEEVTLADGCYIRVSVSDTGMGMSEEIIQRVFEPFYTTKDVGEGTGMGLALVYSTLESYGGAVNVLSENGKGSTFELYFPVTHEEEPADSVTNNFTQVMPNRLLKVLVVDDEALYTELVKNQLTSLGHQATSFTNGHEALQHFISNPHLYDLLITDQVMPDIPGIELSESILDIRPKMDIILTTGYSANIDRENVLSKGIKGFLLKPYTQQDLVEEIDRLIK